MNNIINIGIAEDHGLVRNGFIRMLKDYNRIKIVFESSNGKELLKSLREVETDVILLDIAMPVLNGIAAIEKISQKYPKIKIIVISAHSDETDIIAYFKLGANAFLNKDCTIETLITAIYNIYENGTYLDANTLKLLKKHGLLASDERDLTENEIIMLKLFCGHRDDAEIADLRGLTIDTVRWYKHQIFKKTKCRNMQALILFAQQNNLIK